MMKARTVKVMVLVTAVLLLAAVPMGDGPDSPRELPETHDSVTGTLNDYSSVNTGLPSNGDYFYVTLGDVNGDGYDDLAAGAGQYGGTIDTKGIHVYTSKAGSSWEKNSTGLPTTGTFGGIALGDLDGDDDLDLVAGGESWSGSSIKGICIYLNNGTSGGKLSWKADTKPESNSFYDQVILADVNGDDDLDILSTGRSNGVRVWLGDGGSGGSLSWTLKNSGLPTSGEYCGIAAGDFNDDDKMDIVATDYSTSSPEVHLWTGDGKGNWTDRSSSMPAAYSQTFGVDVGDFNEDGDLDIVYAKKSGGVVCLLGNGGGATGTSFSWTAANTNLPTSGGYAEIDVGDADKDGNLDIVVARTSGGIQLYTGNGGSGGMSWTKASKSLPTSGTYYGACFGDFNDDSVLDIAGAMWGTSTTGGLRAFKGSVTGTNAPEAEAVWKGTTSDELTVYQGTKVELDGTGSSDYEDAPTGDPTGTILTYEWNLTKKPSGSTLTDADLMPNDKNATPTFDPDAVGNYTFTLAVKDTDDDWSATEVSLELQVLKPNDPPVANAGLDQDVYVGEIVYLNASGSTDPDGVVDNWQWNVSAGNPAAVTLVNATLPEASFMAPDVTGTYTFTLAVKDDNETWGEAEDEVNITVSLRPNVPPVADAGADKQGRVNDDVSLNGSGSYDTDGDIVAWDWNCTNRPSLPLTGDDTMEVTFTPRLPGDYNFTLTVLDDRGGWSPEALVNVTVLPEAMNVRPVADIAGAGVRQAYVGDTIDIDGSPSYDDDGEIVEHLWNCTSHPTLVFTGQNTTQISYRADEPGNFMFTLAVKDDNETWSLEEATVTIQVEQPPVNRLPIADIDGPEAVQRPGADVFLDGSASYDPDGPGMMVFDFSWRCISHPSLTFTGQNESAINFTLIDTGDYTFTLKVMDNLNDWSDEPAYFTVRVRLNVPPVANITGDSSGNPGDNVTLSGSGSHDEDGSVVGWRWTLTSHPEVVLYGNSTAEANFTPPAAGSYMISLVVQDNDKVWSQTVGWTVEIIPIDQRPVADAGADMSIRLPASVRLDGSDSYDNEGHPIAAWEWAGNPSVSGLVDADEMVASFTPPSQGVYYFTLRVQDNKGQWSEPDEVMVTVLSQNEPPVVVIVKPKEGMVHLEGDLLRVEWDATDPNGDPMRFDVEIWQGNARIANRWDLPPITTNVTFNSSNFNLPALTDLKVLVVAYEQGTSDGYEASAYSDTFQIASGMGPAVDGDDEGDDKTMTYLMLLILIVVIIGVGAAVSRAGSGAEDYDEDFSDFEDEE